MNTIGIDIGSSTIKLIKQNHTGQIINKLILERKPIKQLLDNLIKEKQLDIKNVEKIVVTGIGKNELKETIYNIPVIKVNELEAIGKGGLFLTKKEEALVVSMGTGTAIIQANKNETKHIGGTGIGGGTLLNLCKKVTKMENFKTIEEAIKQGNLNNIDLKMKDISDEEIKTLPKDITTSNFGKLNDQATKNDITLGIVNMIFETIGMMAVFATKNTKNKDIIMIGNLTKIPYLRIVLDKIEILHNVKFFIPKDAEYAVAIGAIEIAK